MTIPLTSSLVAQTVAIDDPRQLLPFADQTAPLLWVRKGQGMVGLGEALRLEFTGPDRFTRAAAAWREVAAAASVTDHVRRPGTGLVAFGTFAFDDESSATSVLIVPRTIIGRYEDTSFITRISLDGGPTPIEPSSTGYGPEYRIQLVPGDQTRDGYVDAAARAVARIQSGALSKVVLARDLTGHLPAGADLRRVLFDLALGYPDCWTYAVDGFIGSSPETLVRVDRGSVSARVLAGTISRGSDADSDHDQAVALATSAKDQDEHQFAVQSVVNALQAHTPQLSRSEMPFTLKLPNLWHLATDISGRLSDGSSSLDLIDGLHPTAAVAGTPTLDALSLIRELEPFDRGRYAGPVGWVDASGDGEWAVALRCAQIAPDGDITAYAGCGIVADSDPASELIETKMKFRPIVEAFA
ncbi:MAG TPA: isochorismate synthase [Plantibacter sp.]|uniref:isochorismate synthase n=1 Tax=unclassified Plantibacter TaxID=2624265 RepID=UPI002CA5CFFC|nr:isochorismate synthase [Plantibacter sp.]